MTKAGFELKQTLLEFFVFLVFLLNIPEYSGIPPIITIKWLLWRHSEPKVQLFTAILLTLSLG